MRIVTLLTLLLSVLPGILADHGPKPVQDFALVYQTTPAPAIDSAELRQCADAACATWEPLENRPVAYFACAADNCRATSPTGFATWQKLVIHFADRDRESAVFTAARTTNLHNQYTVTVLADRLLIEEQLSAFSFINPYQILLFLVAVPVTLVVELLVAWLYLHFARLPQRRALLTVLVGNLITLPLVWFAFPMLYSYSGLDSGLTIILSELFAFAFEAGLLVLATRSQLTTRQAILLALAANAASFLLPICAAGFA